MLNGFRVIAAKYLLLEVSYLFVNFQVFCRCCGLVGSDIMYIWTYGGSHSFGFLLTTRSPTTLVLWYEKL